ncbi:MAG: PQQ-binding-like beta-propeller repeat protein, partial [Saprospiraceae bacterium]|nr:PQQ-binding-like beta-propeller repeat protein [Saprospiraceae bacterium]
MTSTLHYLNPFGSITGKFLLLILVLAAGCRNESRTVYRNWTHYLGDPHSSQYSPLDQINTENVDQLEVAWTYVTGDSAMYQTNNLIADGRLFSVTPDSRVICLGAASGLLLWEFDPEDINPNSGDADQRGLMYWKDGEDERIMSAKGTWLYSLDAGTGEPVASFGEGGFIHLGEGLDVQGRPNVGLNTPGYIYRDMFIIGTNVPEDVPGAIRAFDIRTGERKWIFHILPRPGEFGSETWPEGYLEHTGGASDWSGIAIDTIRGIVYTSTETAGPDFYGGDRIGQNLFANSLIALDASSGERLWHHQLVHHDLWDMDLCTPPTLLTISHEGQKRDVVAQGGKMGLLFVFDRETGEPIWPIEERPVPQSKIPEIKTWPTQPFPSAPPPLTRQRYTADEYSDISEQATQFSKDVYERSGSFGSFPAPSLEQTIIFPGYDGGMEWGGSAADPDGILYVNVNEIPWFYQLVPTKGPDGKALPFGERNYRVQCAACHGIDRSGYPEGGFPSLVDVSQRLNKATVQMLIENGGGRMPSFQTLSDERKESIIRYLFNEPEPERENYRQDDTPPYVFRGFQRWFDREGYPAIKPPWGTLNAVDLNTGTIKWKVPLGEYKELTERGIPVTGTENYGGPVVTAGGLIFIGASADAKFRAFDKENGKILWEHDLPLDANATPSTYMVNGKQYVVVSAGGAKTNR